MAGARILLPLNDDLVVEGAVDGKFLEEEQFGVRTVSSSEEASSSKELLVCVRSTLDSDTRGGVLTSTLGSDTACGGMVGGSEIDDEVGGCTDDFKVFAMSNNACLVGSPI